MYGTLSKSQIELLLQSQVIGRIGYNYENKIYVFPLFYAYDERYIYCYCEDEGKIGVMRKRPEICFEIDQLNNVGNWQSVIVYGKYEELVNQEAKKAKKVLVNRFPNLTPNSESDSSASILFRIRIEEKVGRFENL